MTPPYVSHNPELNIEYKLLKHVNLLIKLKEQETMEKFSFLC